MDIFVGSLPFKFKDKDLEEIFTAYGKVNSAKVIIDKRTGQSKGFGFVDMAVEKEAHTAIKGLDGSDQLGRAIVVTAAQKNENGQKVERGPRDWNKTGKKKIDVDTWKS